MPAKRKPTPKRKRAVVVSAPDVQVAITDLRPDVHNANAGTVRGLAMLENSISKYGAGRGILADKHGNVIAGNKTLQAAVDAGLKVKVVQTDGRELVVTQRTDLDLYTDTKARELAYADNRVAEIDLAWNAEALLADLNAGVDLSAMFDKDELDAILASMNADEPPADPGAAIDRAEEWQRKWDVQKGQLWIIGRHRLLCGDAYSSEDVTRLLNGKQPDMLHIDPPYGINIVKPRADTSAADSGGAKPFGATGAPGNRAIPDRPKSGKVGGEKGDLVYGATGETKRKGANAVAFRNSVKGDVGGVQRNTAQMLDGARKRNEIIQSNLYPVIEGDDRPFDATAFVDFAPVVVMWGANYFANTLPIHACWIVWDKREDITRNNFADCEIAWTNQDKPARLFHHLWNGLHKGSQNGERRLHPTEKPVALFEEIGRMYADKGLWVDLFAGSGAQLVAAERTGATCYAAECEPLYVATIIERLARMGLTPEAAEA